MCAMVRYMGMLFQNWYNISLFCIFFAFFAKFPNLRQCWGYKYWTYERKDVTLKGGFSYKGDGSTTFCPFFPSWRWRLFDIEWRRNIFCSHISSITGVKIMAGQRTWPVMSYFFSIQNSPFLKKWLVILSFRQLEKSLLEILWTL